MINVNDRIEKWRPCSFLFRWPDLRNLGASLPDDAADDLVWDGHLVSLVAAGQLVPAASRAGQRGQRCNRTWALDLLKTVKHRLNQGYIQLIGAVTKLGPIVLQKYRNT